MSQTDKAFFYQALKKAGVNFDKHYREYSTGELEAAYIKLVDESDSPVEPAPAPAPVSVPQPTRPQPPRIPRNENEMPGQRLNNKDEDEPIRVDEEGLVWYQEEVRKPSFPRPRGRRVLTYMETGTEKRTEKTGDYVETFEVAGEGPGIEAQVKITLPSFQVGIYRDPRFPFKVYIYNENRGFDLDEVNAFYGGEELVPEEVKRVYVEHVLCYDMRTVVRAIQTEYRQQQLAERK